MQPAADLGRMIEPDGPDRRLGSGPGRWIPRLSMVAGKVCRLRPMLMVLPLLMILGALGVARSGEAGSRELDMELHLQPQLDLAGTERIYIGPILLEPRPAQDEGPEALKRVDYAAVRELERYIFKLLRRETRLTLIEEDEARPELPSENLLELAEMPGFWTGLAERSAADYIVAASIDVTVLDRAGYQTEEYVSPEDGKTYFRQVLVEETGFSYDLLLMVFSGETGELVHREQITAFKERSERKLDEYTDMFNDIYKLENRLAGIFVPRSVRAKRYLYTN